MIVLIYGATNMAQINHKELKDIVNQKVNEKIKTLSSKASSDTGKKKTYIPVFKKNNQIISGYTTFLTNRFFNQALDETNKRHPHIYWTPKLHKRPSKFRFITAAPQYFVNTLSMLLKRMYKKKESHDFQIHYFPGFKSF